MRRILAPLLGLLLSFALADAAHAGVPTTVGFDGLAKDTVIDNQYQDLDLDPKLGNEGVLFGPPSQFGLPGNGCTSYADTTHVIAGSASLFNGCNETAEFDRDIGMAFRFETTRRAVSFDLRGLNQDGAASFDVDVTIFDASGGALEKRSVHLTDTSVPVSFTRSGPDIAKVAITASFLTERNRLIFDDLSAPLDDTPPPAEFALALANPKLDVVEGATASAPVSVERYNGSSGPITLSATKPAGIDATQFTPNPVTGIAPASLAVTASSPQTGDLTIPIAATGAASAGTQAGGNVAQKVHVGPALTATNQQASLVPGCGDDAEELLVGVRGYYSGRVTATLTKQSGAVSVLDGVVARDALGNGTLRLPYRLRQAVGTSGDSSITVGLRPEGATPITTNVHVFSYPVSIDGAPSALSQPRWLTDGTDASHVELTGRFPSRCALSYKDDRERPLTQISRTDGVNGAPDHVVVSLPNQELSTVIRAFAPDGTELARTSKIYVSSFRNTHELQFGNGGANAGVPSYGWDDFKRDFGDDDADNCYPIIGCSRDGDAWDLYQGIQKSLTSQPGLCFGYSVMMRRFAIGDENPRTYDSAAARAFDIGSVADGTALKQAVVHSQLEWYDSDWANYVSDLQKSVPSADQFRQQVESAIRANGSAIIGFYQGTGGHAVVAYDVRNPSPSGGFDILTANPNYPYPSTEEYANDGSAPGTLGKSIINIQPNGAWSAWVTGGTPWLGNLSRMFVFDRLPDKNIDIDEGFLAEIFGAPGAAVTSGITQDGKQALAPDGFGLAGSGVHAIAEPTGGLPHVRYKLDTGHTYGVTLTGTGTGTVEHRLGGPGTGATLSGLQMTPGQKDTLQITPGAGTLGWTTSAPSASAELQVHATSSQVRREARIDLTATRGATQQAAISSAGAVTLNHAGTATKLTATLQATGSSGPDAVTTKPIAVGAGGRVELKPSSWRDLAGGVALTVRNAKGKVVRRGKAPLATTNRVGIARRVRAKAKGKTVTVSGTVTKPGAAPLLTVRVQAVRRGKVVATAGGSRRGAAQVRAGRFALPVKLAKLPKGAALRVRVALTDEAADFATQVRTASVRRRR